MNLQSVLYIRTKEDEKVRDKKLSQICFISGAACLLYYLIIVIYAGITADFSWIWIVFALLFGSGGFFLRYKSAHPEWLPGWLQSLLVTGILAGSICFLILCGLVFSKMYVKPEGNLDYVVVLGAHVKGTEPSKALRLRLEKALEYAKENENAVFILSGGKGFGEDITEAKCMENYLTECGIEKERLVLEEASTSTKENLEFSNALTDCKTKKTGILSNNFHVYRAVKLAEKMGYDQASGIAAKSDPIMQLHYVVRETAALIKEFLKGNI